MFRVGSLLRRFTLALQGVAVFICFRVGSLVRFQRSLGSFAFAWDASGAFRGLRVHSISLGFTRARLGVVGHIRVRVVYLCAPKGRRVDWSSRGFSPSRLGVVRVIHVRVDSP